MLRKLIGLFSKPQPTVTSKQSVTTKPPSPPKPQPPNKPKISAGLDATHTPSDIDKWVGWNVCGYIRVAGVTAFRATSENAAINGKLDDVFDLVREPDNPHDKNAIMVKFRGNSVGYIGRQTVAALNEKFSDNMPTRALWKKGYVGETGAISLDILPQMPSSKERKANGWEK